MQKTIYNEIEGILEKLESNLKTLDNKENELKMTIFVQDERIKEVREQYDNKNRELTNNNAHDIKIFEEIQNAANLVVAEINKQQQNDVEMKELTKSKNNIAKIHSELKTYLEEKKDKYNKLQEEKTKYENLINGNPNMSSELRLMYENKIGILNLNIENIEINLNQKLDKCFRILPKELVEKLEIRKEEQVETNQLQTTSIQEEINKENEGITEEKLAQIKQEVITPSVNNSENSMSIQQLNEEVNKQLNSQELGKNPQKNILSEEELDEEDAKMKEEIDRTKGIIRKVKSIKSTIGNIFKRIQETAMNAFYTSGQNVEYNNENRVVRNNNNTQVIDMGNYRK